MSPQHTEKTSIGLDANLAAALSYLLGFVSGIVVLVLRKTTGSCAFTRSSRFWPLVRSSCSGVLLNAVPLLGFLLGVLIDIIPGRRSSGC